MMLGNIWLPNSALLRSLVTQIYHSFTAIYFRSHLYMMPADGLRPTFSHSQSNSSFPAPPVTFSPLNDDDEMSSSKEAVLELNDGSAFRGISFGAEQKSVAGECVFQTGGVFFRRPILCC
jgi:hypothetical protein